MTRRLSRFQSHFFVLACPLFSLDVHRSRSSLFRAINGKHARWYLQRSGFTEHQSKSLVEDTLARVGRELSWKTAPQNFVTRISVGRFSETTQISLPRKVLHHGQAFPLFAFGKNQCETTLNGKIRKKILRGAALELSALEGGRARRYYGTFAKALKNEGLSGLPLDQVVSLIPRPLLTFDESQGSVSRPRRSTHGALPPAFCATVCLSEKGVFLKGIKGPSAFRMLGRFAAGDPGLLAEFENQMMRENISGSLLAEVRTCPESGKYGLQSLTGPLLTFQPSDLLVEINDLDEIELKSKETGQRVQPLVHGAPLSPHASFLRIIEAGPFPTNLAWNRTAKEWLKPHLPRVVFGDVTVSLASWLFDRRKCGRLNSATDPWKELYRLRSEMNLPRWISWSAGRDKPVYFADLDRRSSASLFLKDIGEGPCRVSELFEVPERSRVRTKTGAFTHEIVVPFSLSV